MTKIIIQIGTRSPLDMKLYEFLQSNGFTSILTNCADELHQLGNQNGKQVIIFTDINCAEKFLTDNPIFDFQLLKVLIQPPRIELSIQVVRSLGLRTHTTDRMRLFLDEVHKFLSGDELNNQHKEDIEFTASIKIGEIK